VNAGVDPLTAKIDIALMMRMPANANPRKESKT